MYFLIKTILKSNRYRNVNIETSQIMRTEMEHQGVCRDQNIVYPKNKKYEDDMSLIFF